MTMRSCIRGDPRRVRTEAEDPAPAMQGSKQEVRQEGIQWGQRSGAISADLLTTLALIEDLCAWTGRGMMLGYMALM